MKRSVTGLEYPAHVSRTSACPPTSGKSAAELVGTLERTYRVEDDPSFGPLVNSVSTAQQPFQRWMKYREGYSQELVERIVDNGAAGLLLDPFAGGGTSLVSAQSLGLQSMGYEVNPVVSTISRAKTQIYEPSDYKEIADVVRKIGQLTVRAPTADRPDLKILDKVFRPDVLEALLQARNVLEQVDSAAASDFLQTGYLTILEGVSNCYKEGNGIKYKNRRRTKDGYVEIPWNEVAGYTAPGLPLVVERLQEKYSEMLQDLRSRATTPPAAAVREESCVSGLASVADESIDVCIFSPPYCNNFNYFKVFKVELWMGGYVTNYQGMRQLTEKAIRSHVETTLTMTPSDSGPSEIVEELVGELRRRELWNPRIPDSVVAYFTDMSTVLCELFRILKPGASASIVVGNSAYAGVIIPTDLVLAQYAEMFGFRVANITVARHLTTSPQQRRLVEDSDRKYMRESILTIQKV